MIEDLNLKWTTISSKYTEDKNLITALWNDIVKHYSQNNRHYHNLNHIKNMLSLADSFKQDIQDYDALIFAIWFHDIIYKSTKKDNEEKSALFAKNSLIKLNFDQRRLKNVQNLIISTKKHQTILSENEDNAYLLDLDLSILGSDWKTYKIYTQQIRKEYKIYPDFMYKPGRKKVLLHFLERETLYFTKPFISKFENQARDNIKQEIELL